MKCAKNISLHCGPTCLPLLLRNPVHACLCRLAFSVAHFVTVLCAAGEAPSFLPAAERPPQARPCWPCGTPFINTTRPTPVNALSELSLAEQNQALRPLPFKRMENIERARSRMLGDVWSVRALSCAQWAGRPHAVSRNLRLFPSIISTLVCTLWPSGCTFVQAVRGAGLVCRPLEAGLWASTGQNFLLEVQLPALLTRVHVFTLQAGCVWRAQQCGVASHLVPRGVLGLRALPNFFSGSRVTLCNVSLFACTIWA